MVLENIRTQTPSLSTLENGLKAKSTVIFRISDV
jgi:hypothetical protein